jgi:predicted GH43/DUF377 family glycosyl hydrolase
MGQTEWTEYPDNPVVETDDFGPWAPGGGSVSAVVFDGATYHMWFTGETETSFAGIGHATSTDGLDWVMDQANPVINMGTEGAWDDEYILSGAVIHDGSAFHMWYTGSGGDGEHVGYATSPDGTAWTKYTGNPVMEHGSPGSWDDRWIGITAAMPDGDGFKAWFVGSQGPAGDASIGYATSPDGIDWTKRPDPVLEPGTHPASWEADLFNPTVVFDGSTYHMWYAGDYPNVATKVGYAYSVDGIEWTKHGGNPVLEYPNENIITASVLAGDTGWRMWYAHFGVNPWRISYATSDCCEGEAALDTWRFIPAAAVADGAQGAFFQTDVDVSNADDVAVEYQFAWLPRGENNSEPTTSETFTLGSGMSVRYRNVLTEVFGLEPNSLGALLITSSSPDLLAMSRTYNLPSAKQTGTYGQAIPAVPSGEFIRHGERRRILFGSQGADYRTNIGCINGADMLAAVEIEFFNAEGVSLKTERLRLDPWSNDQLNAPFSDYAPVNGYVDVWTVMPNGSFYCYGSVLDNVTSDPTTILPK